MCLLLLFINPNPRPGQYRLIVASNRDEFYGRPSKAAHWWESHPDILSGTDQEKGKEGGTWLGMHKCGKMGFLLNVTEKDKSQDAKGRGSLVTDFLTGDATVDEYLKSVALQARDYDPFQLLLLENSTLGWNCSYFHKLHHTDPVSLEPGSYCVCNSRDPAKPWKKAEHALSSFREVVDEYNSSQHRAALISCLLNILRDDTSQLPDPNFESCQSKHGIMDMLAQERLSAIFVKLPVYGTRTHTLILVDLRMYCRIIWINEVPLVDDDIMHVNVKQGNISVCGPAI
ncbi:PREDICTED: transport and Golgi organization protein 2 homolog [Priapulus caudatus]|uniref:Transport and Golgi organization protein 2 homolog n=1 Tax=Priapulus caudatus TaxID=37621 RepID=A0ABM1E9I1_PRICU|nr:PREDICTED: transport and Golgi organization protein 2 homolog [Priapulus caudatus]